MHESKMGFTRIKFTLEMGTCFCSCHSCEVWTVAWSVSELRDCSLLLDEELEFSLEVLDRCVLSLVDEGLLDLFEIESRELFDESRVSRIVVLVVVKSVVQSVVGVYSVIVVQLVVVGVDVSIAILFLLSGFAFGCVSETVP